MKNLSIKKLLIGRKQMKNHWRAQYNNYKKQNNNQDIQPLILCYFYNNFYYLSYNVQSFAIPV